MKNSISMRWLVILSILLLSIPLFAYVINFHSKPISEKSDDWSNFAGFIGDILSPVLNTCNILVVYYLALKVGSIEENREEINKNEEKNRRINDFRYTAYKEIYSIIFELIKNIMSNDALVISPILIIQFKFALEGYNKLFASVAKFDLNKMIDRLYIFESFEKDEQLAIVIELNQLIKSIVDEIGFN